MALFRSASFGLLRPVFAITLVLAATGVRLSSSTHAEFQVIHSFTNLDEGTRPYALLQGADGKLYGVTAGGGTYRQGTFFTMTPEGVVTVLHMFSMALDGVAFPIELIQAPDGNFYGSAGRSVFRLTPSGNVAVVYTFPANSYASVPFDLIAAPDGYLYGAVTTRNPVADLGGGIVFRLTPSGLFEPLQTYPGDTDFPLGLTLGSDGNIYGLTSYWAFTTLGGSTVFKITPAGFSTTLHVFTNGEQFPDQLAEGADGNFYGFSCCYGGYPNGSLVKMTPDGVTTVVRALRASESGYVHSLFRARDGHLYGSLTKFSDGSPRHDVSSIIKMTIDGTITFLASSPEADGLFWRVTQASDGTLYGTMLRINAEAGAAFRLRVTVTPTPLGDFDGDGKADVAVFRPDSGVWYMLQSHTGFGTYLAERWGLPTDVPVPGDYDGDGKIDPAMYRPSTGQWFLLTSSSDYTSFVAEPWGLDTDTPVPGDYDGDGRTDLAVYRPSTGVWYLKFSRTNYQTSVAYQWGLSTDIAVPADFDGDGATDIGIYRPSTGQWYVLTSSTNFATVLAVPAWGTTTDIAVPGDYDGDGKADPAVFRPSTGQWYVLMSSTNFTAYLAPVPMWGAASDIAVAGDYDGDGKFDPAVYRPSTGVWYILQSATSYTTYVAQEWGFTTDMPVNHR